MISRQRRAWPYASSGGVVAVGHHRRRPGDVHVLTDDDRAREAGDRLVGRAGGDQAPLHRPSIARAWRLCGRLTAGLATHVAVGVAARGRVVATARRRRDASSAGLGHEAGDRARDSRRGGGGHPRPRRAGRAAGLDRAPPARARVRAAVRRRLRRSRSPARGASTRTHGFQRARRRARERGAEMPFEDYLRAAVSSRSASRASYDGSPGSGIHGGSTTCSRSAASCSRRRSSRRRPSPRRRGAVPRARRRASRTSAASSPNDWGLGVELRDAKSPHWTGTRNSSRTFGHFGGSGTFLWVDPEARRRVRLPDRPEFDEWAVEPGRRRTRCWPRSPPRMPASGRARPKLERSPGSVVGEQWPDQLVERLLVAACDHRRRHGRDRGRPRDAHRQRDLAEVSPGLSSPPLAERLLAHADIPERTT